MYVRHHSHHRDTVIGYRVRQTIRDGEGLVVPGKAPVVLATVEGAGNYLEALDIARAHRTALYKTGPKGRRILSQSEADRHQVAELYCNLKVPADKVYVRTVDYACVDSIYADGCRWGDDDHGYDGTVS